MKHRNSCRPFIKPLLKTMVRKIPGTKNIADILIYVAIAIKIKDLYNLFLCQKYIDHKTKNSIQASLKKNTDESSAAAILMKGIAIINSLLSRFLS